MIRFSALLAVLIPFALCQANNQDASPESEIAAGHSYHGEAFNEGPRQAAFLMEGMGSINFPSSATETQTQAFINQGVAQLHGFWYFEAERSFRQAAMLQADLAIAYWGMALANANNDERAIAFMVESEKHLGKASEREKLYIRAHAKYLRTGKSIQEDKKLSEDEKKDREREREQDYLKDLEKIIDLAPDDIEAYALLTLRLWQASRNHLPVASHYAVDSLMDHIFAAEPHHPAHHYRIHLWDNRRPENALQSAALCGPALPGIAHMWHMPGHIYSRLHRYSDAVWQQQASARVDHQQMIQNRLLPDQIHNFAHNNEWMIRNLLFLGQTHQAIAQAKNLIALPRHPKYNTLDKKGSYSYGRERYLDTLTKYEMWPELIEASDGPWLSPSDQFDDRINREKWLSVALTMTGDVARGREILREMQRERLSLQSELLTPAKQPESFDAKSHREKTKKYQEAIALAAAAIAAKQKNVKLLEKQLSGIEKTDPLLKARFWEECGRIKDGLELVKKSVKASPNQVLPQAALVHMLWKSGDKKSAQKEFTKLRTLAATADLDSPPLARLAPIAAEFKFANDWRLPAKMARDLGERPSLDSLGPEFWSPYPTPRWVVQSSEDKPIASTSIHGRPTLVVFYLGFGCLHCVEQLGKLTPQAEAFEKAGIQIMAISSESVDAMRQGLANYDKPLPFPLHSDGKLKAFKAMRCFDDFEKKPLHGTFLVDGEGRVRWQDIGFEPFMDIDFLLEESRRLLALPPPIDESK